MIRLDQLTQIMMDHDSDTIVDKSRSMLMLAALYDEDIQKWMFVLNEPPGFANDVAIWIFSANDIRYQIVSDRVEELRRTGRRVYIH